MSQHQLPCENCGQIIPVTPTLAGSLVTCPHCGHAMQAPKLGVLRGLPQVDSQAAAGRSRREWTAANGLLFTAGFVLLLLGLVGSLVCYQRYLGHHAAILELNPDGVLPDYSDLSRFEARVANLTVDQLWTEWREALKDTLGEWNPTRFRFVQDQKEEAYLWFIGYCAVTGVGLVLAISGFLVSFSPVRRPGVKPRP
jgi:hypothetical protein